MSNRVIPIPDSAKPEIRLLLQKTRWDNRKTAEVSSLMAVGIQNRIREATDRFWEYLFKAMPKINELGDTLSFDKVSFRVIPVDEAQNSIGDGVEIPKEYHVPLLHLQRDIEVAEESRSVIAYVVKQLDAEADMAFNQLMSSLRRHVPEMNDGALWGVDPNSMIVYETDSEEIQKKAEELLNQESSEGN